MDLVLERRSMDLVHSDGPSPYFDAHGGVHEPGSMFCTFPDFKPASLSLFCKFQMDDKWSECKELPVTKN